MYLITEVSNDQKPIFSLNDIMDGKLSAKSVHGIFLEDSSAYLLSDDKGIVRVSVDGKVKTRVYEWDSFGGKYETGFFVPNGMGTKLLLIWQKKPRWGRSWSFSASYVVYDVATKSVDPVDDDIDAIAFVGDQDKVAYVKESNVYFDKKQVTFDGTKDGVILNGMSWVYEEEVFQDSQSLFPSEDGKWLAFLKFNHSLIKPFSFNQWSPSSAYPEEISVEFPFPGTPNPIAWVGLVDVGTMEEKELKVPGDLIIHLSFAPKNELLIVTSNRQQTEQKFWLVDPATLASRTVFSRKAKFGWFEVVDKVIFCGCSFF